MDKIFVYGSLMPNEKNNFILKKLNGTWRKAYTFGHLKIINLGIKEKYKSIILDIKGKKIFGYIFSSFALKYLWKQLDEFEGDNYQRVESEFFISSTKRINAYVYKYKNRQYF
jgi:gamma-glutamylcyclotransferase (GGCT)/AIG2-like uncharacterized protein YtfP